MKISEPFVRAGERVVTEDGRYICRVAKDLHDYDRVVSSSFDDWQVHIPEVGDPLDHSYIRRCDDGAFEICVEGKWRRA